MCIKITSHTDFFLCIYKLYTASKIVFHWSLLPCVYAFVSFSTLECGPAKRMGCHLREHITDICGFHLWCSLSLFLVCSLWWKPCCKLPCGEALWQGMEGGLQSVDREEWAPQSTFCEELKPANNHVNDLRSGSPPFEPSDGTAARWQHDCSLMRSFEPTMPI